MCGLFGGISSFLSDSEVENVANLGYLSLFRGKDSTGIGAVKKASTVVNKKRQVDVGIHKNTLPAGAFFYDMDTWEFLKKWRAPNAILGHTRAATDGAVNDENAMPFAIGNVLATHNGQFGAFVQKDSERSDSYHFLDMMVNDSLEAALEKAHSDALCAYALVWYDADVDEVRVVRNTLRPLWRLGVSGTHYYASTQEILDFVKQKTYGMYGTPVAFETGKLHRMSLTDRIWRSDKLTIKKTYTPPLQHNIVPWRGNDDWWRENYSWEHGLDRTEKGKNKRKEKKDRKKKENNTPINHGPILIGQDKKSPLQNTSTLNYEYYGFDKEKMSLEEAYSRLKDGCQLCYEVPEPSNKAWWIDYDQYICNRCYQGSTRKMMYSDAQFNESRLKFNYV